MGWHAWGAPSSRPLTAETAQRHVQIFLCLLLVTGRGRCKARYLTYRLGTGSKQ